MSEIYKEFKINVGNSKFIKGKHIPLWYVYNPACGEYLHKDITLHNFCGIEGFYESLEEAKNSVDRFYGETFISADEMEI